MPLDEEYNGYVHGAPKIMNFGALRSWRSLKAKFMVQTLREISALMVSVIFLSVQAPSWADSRHVNSGNVRKPVVDAHGKGFPGVWKYPDYNEIEIVDSSERIVRTSHTAATAPDIKIVNVDWAKNVAFVYPGRVNAAAIGAQYRDLSRMRREPSYKGDSRDDGINRPVDTIIRIRDTWPKSVDIKKVLENYWAGERLKQTKGQGHK